MMSRAAKGRVAAYDVETIYQAASKGTLSTEQPPSSRLRTPPRTCNLDTRLPHTAPLDSSHHYSLLCSPFLVQSYTLLHSIQGSFFFLLSRHGAADIFSLRHPQAFVRPTHLHPSHPISSSFRPLLVPSQPLFGQFTVNRRSEKEITNYVNVPRAFL